MSGDGYAITHLEMRFRGKGVIDCDRALGCLGRLEEQRKREERKRHARKLAASTTPVCQWCDQNVCRESGADG